MTARTLDILSLHTHRDSEKDALPGSTSVTSQQNAQKTPPKMLRSSGRPRTNDTGRVCQQLYNLMNRRPEKAFAGPCQRQAKCRTAGRLNCGIASCFLLMMCSTAVDVAISLHRHPLIETMRLQTASSLWPKTIAVLRHTRSAKSKSAQKKRQPQVQLYKHTDYLTMLFGRQSNKQRSAFGSDLQLRWAVGSHLLMLLLGSCGSGSPR